MLYCTWCWFILFLNYTHSFVIGFFLNIMFILQNFENISLFFFFSILTPGRPRQGRRFWLRSPAVRRACLRFRTGRRGCLRPIARGTASFRSPGERRSRPTREGATPGAVHKQTHKWSSWLHRSSSARTLLITIVPLTIVIVGRTHHYPCHSSMWTGCC